MPDGRISVVVLGAAAVSFVTVARAVEFAVGSSVVVPVEAKEIGFVGHDSPPLAADAFSSAAVALTWPSLDANEEKCTKSCHHLQMTTSLSRS